MEKNLPAITDHVDKDVLSEPALVIDGQLGGQNNVLQYAQFRQKGGHCPPSGLSHSFPRTHARTSGESPLTLMTGAPTCFA